jgi:hypothetical protein
MAGAVRFDLPDTGDIGTCHFVDEVETAVRESLGPRLSADQTVTPDLPTAYTVSAIVPAAPRRYAHVHCKAAVRPSRHHAGADHDRPLGRHECLGRRSPSVGLRRRAVHVAVHARGSRELLDTVRTPWNNIASSPHQS